MQIQETVSLERWFCVLKVTVSLRKLREPEIIPTTTVKMSSTLLLIPLTALKDWILNIALAYLFKRKAQEPLQDVYSLEIGFQSVWNPLTFFVL